jgi:hypothetical protein
MQQFGKRQKELARLQYQREKAERKKERAAEKDARPARADGAEDPDIAGIVPGPQPLPDEFLTPEERALKNAPPKPSGSSQSRAL